VLAGLGLESPRASFTGPTGSPRRASIAAPEGAAMNLLTSPTAALNRTSSPLLTAPAAVAGMVAGAAAMGAAAAGSGGSFTSAGAPGTPGRSRLSNLGDERGSQEGVYAAVAADLGGSGATAAAAAGELRRAPALWAHMGDPSAVSPTGLMPAGWGAEGAVSPGYRVPLVHVVLPGGGCAYCPADSLPAGAVVATPEQMAAAAAGALVLAPPAGAPGPQENVTLSGGIGPACVDLQVPAEGHLWQQQPWQQQQGMPDGQHVDVASGAAAAGQAASYSPFLEDGPREQAQLQDRAEAIFGQPMVPSIVDMLPAATQQQADTSAAAAGAAAAVLGAASVGALQSTAGPGWMSQPAEVDSTGARGGFSLWEGVVAAAATGGPAPAGRSFAAASSQGPVLQGLPLAAANTKGAGLYFHPSLPARHRLLRLQELMPCQ
jgi:hypothetical protein